MMVDWSPILLQIIEMWDIIIWETENAVDMVPSIWGNKAKTAYKYPTKKVSQATRKKLIYACKDLETDYKVSSARCIKANIIDLKQAQKACKQGEMTSNIDTESEETSDENGVNGKRLRKIPKRLLLDKEDPSDDSQSGSDHPVIRKKLFYVPSSASRNDPFGDAAATSTVTPVVTPTTSTCSSRVTVPGQRFCASAPATRTPTPTLPLAVSGITESDIQYLKRQATETNFELKEVKACLNDIRRLLSTNSATNADEDEEDILNAMPCLTQIDIEKLENLLTDPKNKKRLIHMLYLVGGDTVQKTVNLSLSKLLGREISLQYSGQGRKKKLPFCNLKMHGAVFDAVRKRHPASSDEEIKKAIGLYLATAKSRISSHKENPGVEALETPDEDF